MKRLILVLGLITNCTGTATQRRAEIEKSEDKFCAAVASARELERATGTLPVEADAGK